MGKCANDLMYNIPIWTFAHLHITKHLHILTFAHSHIHNP